MKAEPIYINGCIKIFKAIKPWELNNWLKWMRITVSTQTSGSFSDKDL